MLMRCLTAAAAALMLVNVSLGGKWDRFRGPNGQGVSDDTKVPLKWDDTKNLKWKRKLPGPGTSSPIIVGDKVFVTCYSGYGVGGGGGKIENLTRHLVCVSRKDGKILWDKTVVHKGREDRYTRMLGEHGYASNTPTTDGKNVYAFYGKSGVVAYDL
ncbi:MAG: PQQ-binding-like beta-propeller repeat protein, partial [Planctomycetaceae bacterium]